jgi:FlaA1/EpsC-like NDP-sugar epimerase
MVAIRRMTRITKRPIILENVDITNADQVKAVFKKYSITSVIHFAALKVIAIAEMNLTEE